MPADGTAVFDIVRPVRVVVAAIRFTTTSWLVSARPRPFMLMCANNLCSILLHLLVPGARLTDASFSQRRRVQVFESLVDGWSGDPCGTRYKSHAAVAEDASLGVNAEVFLTLVPVGAIAVYRAAIGASAPTLQR